MSYNKELVLFAHFLCLYEFCPVVSKECWSIDESTFCLFSRTSIFSDALNNAHNGPITDAD